MTVDTASLPGLLDGLDLIRADFPILGRTLADGHPLVYLDSANTSQKPQVVIDAMVERGVRDRYIVLVGGAPVNEEFKDAVGADGYCRDAAVAAQMAKEMVLARQAAARHDSVA